MYHLLVKFGENSWARSPARIPRSRFLEYSDDETLSRFSELDEKRIEELKEFPALFMCEDESSPTFLGKITGLKLRGDNIFVHFERILDVPSFPEGAIQSNSQALDIHDFEFHRTHWAIKDEYLYGVLLDEGLLTKEQIVSSNVATGNVINANNIPPSTASGFNDQQIFIVHGHDDLAKNDVRSYVQDIGKEPIILHMQASGGMTIIEKIDYYSNVGFAIVLYTECDVGAKRDSLTYRRRARQNVVFEHGYLIGKIGRPRVVALVKGDVETPNDISGVVYVQMTSDDSWKNEINYELKNCGYL
jgi:predicted nucleotide-binding protein